MRILSYGVLMALALCIGWTALLHADRFRPFNRKPTLATDLVAVLPEVMAPATAG